MTAESIISAQNPTTGFVKVITELWGGKQVYGGACYLTVGSHPLSDPYGKA